MKYQCFSLYRDEIPGFNEIIAAAKTFGKNKNFNGYSVLKKKWSEEIKREIRNANIKPVESAYLKLKWHEPNKRRDPDNIAAFIKVILDAMQEAGIIRNDGWREIEGWKNEFIVSKKRGVEVIIYGKSYRKNQS